MDRIERDQELAPIRADFPWRPEKRWLPQPKFEPASAPQRISTISASAEPLAATDRQQRTRQRLVGIGGGIAGRIHGPVFRDRLAPSPWRKRSCPRATHRQRHVDHQRRAGRGSARRRPADRYPCGAANRHERPWRWACWRRGKPPTPSSASPFDVPSRLAAMMGGEDAHARHAQFARQRHQTFQRHLDSRVRKTRAGIDAPHRAAAGDSGDGETVYFSPRAPAPIRRHAGQAMPVLSVHFRPPPGPAPSAAHWLRRCGSSSARGWRAVPLHRGRASRPRIRRCDRVSSSRIHDGPRLRRRSSGHWRSSRSCRSGHRRPDRWVISRRTMPETSTSICSLISRTVRGFPVTLITGMIGLPITLPCPVGEDVHHIAGRGLQGAAFRRRRRRVHEIKAIAAPRALRPAPAHRYILSSCRSFRDCPALFSLDGGESAGDVALGGLAVGQIGRLVRLDHVILVRLPGLEEFFLDLR